MRQTFGKLLIIILFQGVLLQGYPQETRSVNGIVFDSLTGKELPFAQVALKNCNLGTVTNEEGYFTIEFSSLFNSDTLLIAFMGYETNVSPLSKLTMPNQRFAMKPKSFQLAEIEVIALSPEEVIRQTIAHISDNYGSDSLILTAFIRSQKYLGGKLAEFTEAIVEDLKLGYFEYPEKEEKKRNRQSNIPFLVKGRVISDTNLVNALGDLGKSAGCLGCNFTHDFIEFYHHTVLDEQIFKFYTFKMEELIKPEGGKIYHIWFDQKKGLKETLWKGELIINAADFALLKITQKPSFEAFNQYEKQKYKRSFTIYNSPGWIEEMPMMEWTTTYAQRNGHYYLSTIQIENWLTFTNQMRNQKVKFSHKNEVVVTDATRSPERIRNFKGDKSIGVNQRWDQLVVSSDDHFWEQFNYIPVEKKLQEAIRQIMNK